MLELESQINSNAAVCYDFSDYIDLKYSVFGSSIPKFEVLYTFSRASFSVPKVNLACISKTEIMAEKPSR
jgi:hypothetical protein